MSPAPADDLSTASLEGNPHEYRASDFAHDGRACCDLIMKGGITSGVVYPHAVCELATKYRLLEIGGTSAGALAAAMTAAAEFHRQRAGGVPPDGENAGYLRVSRLPEFFARENQIFDLFQPVGALAPHFEAVISAMRASKRPGRLRWARTLWPVLKHFPVAAAAALGLLLLPLALLLPRYLVSGGSAWVAALAVLAAAVPLVLAPFAGAVLSAGLSLYRWLPRLRFGLCSGRTMRRGGDESVALTDWLHREIQGVAGLEGTPGERPLSFGDLQRERIELSMITTDLGQGRPFELSLNHVDERPSESHFGAFHYKESDFAELFPPPVVEAMLAASGPGMAAHDGETLYRWPAMRDVPVVVATRLSFGLPVLLQATPLFRTDPTLRGDADREQFHRCLLSDGGISSNLPIHFFDTAFPDRATFAISLEEYSEPRHGPSRVAMYTGGPEDEADPLNVAGRRRGIPITPIRSVVDFVASIVHSAKDWQDVVQSIQAGYRDRIVHVALKDSEGGLNLDISPDAVKRMINLGRLAGQRLLQFDLAAHRWRRFLSVTDMIEREFSIVNGRWHKRSEVDDESFREFVGRHASVERHFKPPLEDDPAWVDDAQALYDSVSELGAGPRDRRLTERAPAPRPRTDLKARPRL